MGQDVSAPPFGSPDDFLGFTVVRLAHVLQKRIDHAMLRVAGLSVRQFGALAYLREKPGIGSAALARKLLITAQSAGPLVDDLVARGLVERDDPGQAGLRKAIRVTPKGNEVLATCFELVARLHVEDAAAIAPVAAEQLNRTLLVWLQQLSGNAKE